MKNKNKIIIAVLLIVIIGLLLWLILSNSKEELIFNISVDKSEIMFGESIKINYELNRDKEIKWESSNNDIAKIENGNVIGVGIGNVIIKGTINIDDVLKRFDKMSYNSFEIVILFLFIMIVITH